ncbi:MAG: hypothetical protein JW705_06850, partial [Methanosarcinaceae archaeon]|nr:hypothetical protein [Methanosarcinaceae archaeon]
MLLSNLNLSNPAERIGSGPGEIRTPDLLHVNAQPTAIPTTIHDLAQFWAQHNEPFNAWLIYKDISARSKQSYINALIRFFETYTILKPQELRAITLKDKEYRGLRALFNYCEEEEIDEVAGYTIEKWRRYIKIKPSGVVEIYVTDDEMREAYGACAVDLKPFFELLTYSGSRFSHVYEMLDNFDERNIIVDGEVAHYPTSWLSKGTKRTFHIFFPASFIPTLKNMGTNKSYKTLTKDLQYGRVSAKIIRKWHLNLMVAAGISESLADFIQGRSAATVGSAHYLNKVQQSREAYRRLVGNFDNILQGTSKQRPALAHNDLRHITW